MIGKPQRDVKTSLSYGCQNNLSYMTLRNNYVGQKLEGKLKTVMKRIYWHSSDRTFIKNHQKQLGMTGSEGLKLVFRSDKFENPVDIKCWKYEICRRSEWQKITEDPFLF